MSMRFSIATDDVSVLSRLIDHGALAITMRRNIEQHMLDANLELVLRAAARPSEGNRVIGEHTVMFATAIKRCDVALHQHGDREAAIYGRVIGALFPDIRADFGRALEIRKRPTA